MREREKERKKGIKDSFKLICLVKRTTESGICKSEKHTHTKYRLIHVVTLNFIQASSTLFPWSYS